MAARHLIGSATTEDRNKIRRTWSHGEITSLATVIVSRSVALTANPAAPVPHEHAGLGPLLDIAARDVPLVSALRLFVELQELRHRADYDHDAKFDKLSLVNACNNAGRAMTQLATAAPAAREAFFALLTVRRKDFRER
jgi:hypothetical protein